VITEGLPEAMRATVEEARTARTTSK
jgi:hypothetical protein